MLPAWEKITNSGRRLQFLFQKFQLSGLTIWIYLAESGTFLHETLRSTLVETNTSWPEDQLESVGGEILSLRSEDAILLGKVLTFWQVN